MENIEILNRAITASTCEIKQRYIGVNLSNDNYGFVLIDSMQYMIVENRELFIKNWINAISNIQSGKFN